MNSIIIALWNDIHYYIEKLLSIGPAPTSPQSKTSIWYNICDWYGICIKNRKKRKKRNQNMCIDKFTSVGPLAQKSILNDRHLHNQKLIFECCLVTFWGFIFFAPGESLFHYFRIPKIRELLVSGMRPWCWSGRSHHQSACRFFIAVSRLKNSFSLVFQFFESFCSELFVF